MSTPTLRLVIAGLFLFAVALLAQQNREATLAVRILEDATGQPVPARIHLEDEKGNRPRTRGAVAISETSIPIARQVVATMWGQNDRAEGYALQPDGSFYVDGGFDVRVPPGHYVVTVSKGFEYRRQKIELGLARGTSTSRDVRIARWIGMPSRGWYSSDDHIHVGNILQMGDFLATYFSQYSFGERGRYEENGRILVAGQEEPRTPEIGHTISLAAREMVRIQQEYYSYDSIACTNSEASRALPTRRSIFRAIAERC